MSLFCLSVGDTALLINAFKLDYDNTSAIRFYTLNTVVTDLGGNIATCNLNVSLNPVNEAPTCNADFEAGTGKYSQTVNDKLEFNSDCNELDFLWYPIYFIH